MTTAKKHACAEPYLDVGTVERVLDGTIEIRLGSGTTLARRAPSCLVAPESGDQVLCAFTGEATFLLAVLASARGSRTRLVTEGDLEIQSQQGRVALSARKGLDLRSQGDIDLSAPELRMRAKKGTVAVEELGLFGRLAHAQVAKIVAAAGEIDSVVTRLTQRAKRVFRFVEELDQTRAGTVDVRAQSLLGMRAENAIVSARVLAKVDGEQIHLG